MTLDTDLSDVLPAIRVPTLVLAEGAHARARGARREPDPEAPRWSMLPGDGASFARERRRAARQSSRSSATRRRRSVPDTVLATVLFTDLVGSTRARGGARRPRAGASVLEAASRGSCDASCSRVGGVELDTAGDGFFATFDGPARAIGCARAIVAAMPALGLAIRVGHPHRRVRARRRASSRGWRSTSARGSPPRPSAGEVLVSGTVQDLVAGSGFAFDDLGEHELKGVPGSWRLLRVVA